jgi:hypothetical protein
VLGVEDFFRLVGRADLASTYSTRNAVRLGLGLGGAAVVLAGGVTLFTPFAQTPCHIDDPQFAYGCGQQYKKFAILGISGLAGLALVTSGLFINPLPVEPEMMRRLADGYNAELRRKLSSAATSVADHPSELTFGMTAYLAPGGGGLALTGTF